MKKYTAFISGLLIALAVALFACGCSLLSNQPEEPPEEEVYVRVTYDAFGGRFADGENFKSTEVLAGGKLTIPDDPTKADCIFKGWGTSTGVLESIIDPATFIVPKDEEWIRLFAQWTSATEDKLLTFEGATVQKGELEKIVSADTETFSLAGIFTYSKGSILEVRYKGSDVTEQSVTLDSGDNIFNINVCSPSKARVNSYTLNIHRSHEITVTYRYDGNEIYTDTTYSGYEYTVSCPEEIPGYDIVGWEQDRTKVEKIVPMGNITLNAEVEPKTFTVTYELQGGECGYTTYDVKYGESFRLPKVTKAGSEFEGWYYGDRLMGYDGKALEYDYLENVTFTAHWKALSYEISVYADTDIFEQKGTVSCGGEYGRDEKVTLEYGDEVTLSVTIKSGYTFIGWYASITSATAVSYKPEWTFSVTESVGYVAKWKPQSEVITAFSNVSSVILPDTSSYGEDFTVKTKFSSLAPLTFAGWYRPNISANCLSAETEYTFNLTPNVVYRLEARWEGEGLDDLSISTSDGTNFMVTGAIDPEAVEVVIPDYISSIASTAFNDNQNVVRVTLGSGLTSLGNSFKSCYKLVEIYNRSSIDLEGLPIAENALRITNDESSAVETDYAGGYIFYDDGEKAYLLGRYGNSADLTLPKDYHGKSYEIYKYAFYGKSALKSIEIAECTENIGAYAFAHCGSLEQIKYNAAEMPDYTENQYLTTQSGSKTVGFTVTVGKNVKRVPSYLFGDELTPTCVLKAVYFDKDCVCTSIGAYAFYNNYLEYACVPQHVGVIGAYAYSSQWLSTIDYYAEDAEVHETAFRLAGEKTALGLTLNVKETVYRLPSDVTSRRSNGYGPKIGAVDFSEGVAVIGSLEYAAITTVTIPSTVESIGAYIFHGCTELTTIYYNAASATMSMPFFWSGDVNKVTLYVGTSVRSIPKNFGDSRITSVIFMGDGCKTIEESAFYGSSVTTLKLPGTIESIGDGAFQYMTNLTSINIPASVKTIGKQAFSYCGDLTIEYEAEEMTDCNIKYTVESNITLKIGTTVRKLVPDSFGACVVSVVFNDKIEQMTVCENAFDCPDLTSIYLGGKDVEMESGAFTFGYTSVALTYNVVTGPDTEGDVFATSADSKLQVTVGGNVTRIPAKLFFKSEQSESTLSVSKITFDSGRVELTIGSYAFAGLGNIASSVTVPNYVTAIGERAFFGTTFNSVTYDASECDDFDDYVFENTSIYVGQNVTRLPSKLAINNSGSNKFVSFDYASRLESIGSHAISGFTLTKFYDAKNLKVLEPYALADDITISEIADWTDDSYMPANIEVIGEYAFSGVDAKNVVKITLPNVKSLGAYAFKDCKVRTITVGGSYTSIPEGCFSGCEKITDFEIISSVREIGVGAFSGCTNLTSVIFKVYKSWKADTELSQGSLTQPDVAARYLTDTYADKTWTRT